MKITRDQIQYLITKFVENPTDWAKETIAAKRIFSKWPRTDFWYLQEGKKFGSLLCLLTPKSKAFIDKKYQEFLVDNPIEKKYHLQDSPIETEEIVTSKHQSLMDFLNA